MTLRFPQNRRQRPLHGREDASAPTQSHRKTHIAKDTATGDSERLTLHHLEEHRLRLLEAADDLVGERRADVAVDDAVVERERQDHHVADHDLAVAHDGLLLIWCTPRMRDLGEVDDRRREQAAELAERGDRERRAAEVLALEPCRSCAVLGEALDLARDLEERSCDRRRVTTGTMSPASVAAAMPMW